MQVICGLMKHPQYLSETDKYFLTIEDFPNRFEKYIFSAIYNLYKGGAQNITVVDISNYFNTHEVAKATFEKNNGIEYLQDILEFSEADNFPFYYKRLKKFNLLESLNKLGYNTSNLYEENLTNPHSKEINDKFELMDLQDIMDAVKKPLLNLEVEYTKGGDSETYEATKGIQDLIQNLKLRPEIGSALQGSIFNTVCRGARKTKFYIRSASSGVGKTRAAVGDACSLAYPLTFNQQTWEWEWTGANERTLFIATEQDLEEIQTLVLAFLSGINEEKILYGSYNEAEERVLQQAVQVMDYFKDNLYIVRLSNPSIEQVKAVVRQNWILHDIQNVFYDYIFSSPSLLNEFRDLKIREDVALGMLSTALKDLAVEMRLFVMSSTQTNAKSEDDQKGIKNESVIRGSRAIIDKCDIACVASRVSSEEQELLADLITRVGRVPNQVLDVYKVRRGKYTNVRIWSDVDLGTCRKKDLFITNEKLQPIEGFEELYFKFDESDNDFLNFMKELNSNVSERTIEHSQDNIYTMSVNPPITFETVEEKLIDLAEVEKSAQKSKGLFGDLM